MRQGLGEIESRQRRSVAEVRQGEADVRRGGDKAEARRRVYRSVIIYFKVSYFIIF